MRYTSLMREDRERLPNVDMQLPSALMRDAFSLPSTIKRRFSLLARIRSFRYAIYGIAVMLTSQHNAWLHAVATLVIVGLGTIFGLSAGQWCWLVLAIMAVWTAEALNTALELLADVASPDFHPLVKQAKDVAAGAVLISACGATVIGALILGPPLFTFLGLLK